MDDAPWIVSTSSADMPSWSAVSPVCYFLDFFDWVMSHAQTPDTANLPGEIEAGLDQTQISKMLGESLRQHFLRSGVQDTVSVLQTTSAAMTVHRRNSLPLCARYRIRMAV